MTGVSGSWQPIGTAPQNGTRVRVAHELDPNSLKTDGLAPTTGVFKGGEWQCNNAFVCIDMTLRWQPTHWLPEQALSPPTIA